MKGVIFDVLEEVVVREHGDAVWDELVLAAGSPGPWTSLGSYPDAELGALVTAASQKLELPPNDVMRWVGLQAAGVFAARYPELFAAHTTTRAFLLTLNDIIHPEVRKLYPGADVPEFAFDTSRPAVLVLGYHSARKMCAFAEGLVHGSAAHFGERVTIEQPRCMLRGDTSCQLELAFTAAP